VSFEEDIAGRSAEVYADFLFPHLTEDASILDVGCGTGTITVGIAPRVERILGVDLEDAFDDARAYAAEHDIGDVGFRVGDVYALDLPDDMFDACFSHSMLETLERPLDGLREILRVLRPGGILAAASIEYGGLILAGPDEPLLRRSYALREQLWILEGEADPYRGRQLRGLLTAAGFERVVATSTYLTYGTPDLVRSFGMGRAEDFRDPWYVECGVRHGLADQHDLHAMSRAWTAWSEASDAYAAFAWCRAIGWKPSPE
jgi:SAM-dependent methyltransferase